MLNQCIELLGLLGREDLSLGLCEALKSTPLEQPEDHRGGAAVQMFRLQMPADIRQSILAAMQSAVLLELTTTATDGRGLAGFVEAWREYANDEKK